MEDLRNESISYARIFSILSEWNLACEYTYKKLSVLGNENAKLYLKTRPKAKNGKGTEIGYGKNIKNLIKETLTAYSQLCKQRSLDIREYSAHLVTCFTPNENLDFKIVGEDAKTLIYNLDKKAEKYDKLVSREINFVENSAELKEFKEIIKKVKTLQIALDTDLYQFKKTIGVHKNILEK